MSFIYFRIKCVLIFLALGLSGFSLAVQASEALAALHPPPPSLGALAQARGPTGPLHAGGGGGRTSTAVAGGEWLWAVTDLQ